MLLVVSCLWTADSFGHWGWESFLRGDAIGLGDLGLVVHIDFREGDFGGAGELG